MKKHLKYFLEGWALLSMIMFPLVVITTQSPWNIVILSLSFLLGWAFGWAIQFTKNINKPNGEDI